MHYVFKTNSLSHVLKELPKPHTMLAHIAINTTLLDRQPLSEQNLRPRLAETTLYDFEKLTARSTYTPYTSHYTITASSKHHQQSYRQCMLKISSKS